MRGGEGVYKSRDYISRSPSSRSAVIVWNAKSPRCEPIPETRIYVEKAMQN